MTDTITCPVCARRVPLVRDTSCYVSYHLPPVGGLPSPLRCCSGSYCAVEAPCP